MAEKGIVAWERRRKWTIKEKVALLADVAVEGGEANRAPLPRRTAPTRRCLHHHRQDHIQRSPALHTGTRYYVSSSDLDADRTAQAVRGH